MDVWRRRVDRLTDDAFLAFVWDNRESLRNWQRDHVRREIDRRDLRPRLEEMVKLLKVPINVIGDFDRLEFQGRYASAPPQPPRRTIWAWLVSDETV